MDLSMYYNDLAPLPADNIKYLVVHHSATSPDLDIEDIHRMHLNEGFTCVGYHAIIKKDGTVQWGRPMDSQGAQTYGYNHCSLGVCLIGYFHRDSVNRGQYPDKPTDKQLESLVQILVNWKRKIPQNVKIVGHRELCQTACPGDGFTHLMLDGIAKKVEEALKNTGEPVTVTPSDKKYNELVYKYSQQYNLRPEFVHSIIFQESRYNPKAVSKSNAKGLMQLLLKTWEEVTKKLCIENPDPFDPEINIRAGCYYLDWCRKNMNVEWAMAAGYNQGIGNYKKGTMPVDGLKYANEVMERIYVEK